MSTATTDYYQVLEVPRTATAEEIRKAHRRLSKKYHPDRNKDDQVAAAKFKEVQQAWDVLGDEEKRRQYDQFGHVFPGGANGSSQPNGWSQASPGGRTWTWSSAGSDGQFDFDLESLLGGLGGGRGGFGADSLRSANRPRRGQDARAEITVPFQVAVEGGKYDVSLTRGGTQETLTVNIPAGIESGSTIRLRGQGPPSANGGGAGDLLVTVQVAKHPVFRREGNNLMVDVEISPAQAALGAKVNVPTLSQGEISMTVPPGTSSGGKLRMRGQGVPDRKTKVRGDLLAEIKIVVPKKLTERERELYQELLGE